MPSAHLYLFSDGCPSDPLVDGKDETWHTIVNFVFQPDPSLQPLVDMNKNHIDVLGQDKLFCTFIGDLETQLSTHKLQKWNAKSFKTHRRKHRYRVSFCQSFKATLLSYKPIISVCSFQEKILRASKTALLQSYNARIGGIEGRGIGFKEFKDDYGRLQMKHSFVNYYGFHVIQSPENQMLILLLMSLFIADQYVFYWKDIVASKRYGFDRLGITVVSDKLSGDNDSQQKNEQNLRELIDPEGEGFPVVLTRSPKSDTYSGDLLVDNLAGWLNAAISDPAGEFAQYAKGIAPSGVWTGWHLLLESDTELKFAPALSRLIV